MDTVRPTLKLLNKFVKPFVTTKWYDLGIELLANEDVKALDEIQCNYPRDVGMCCTKMFQSWLDKQPKASWSALLQALRERHIGQNELANTIEQELKSINKGKCVEPDIGIVRWLNILIAVIIHLALPVLPYIAHSTLDGLT